MAQTTNKKLDIDLCPRKPNKLVMDVGDTKVVVLVSVTTKDKPAPIVLERLADKAARPVMAEYQKIVQEEVDKLQAKFLDMVKKRNAKGAAELAKETSLSVRNACKALPAAVETAVKNQIKIDYRDDQNLLEAQIKVGIKVTFTVISVGKNIATLAVTAGADVSAWYGLAKNIATLAQTINNETKDEQARRKDLLTAIGKYTTETTRRRILADKANKSNKAKLELAYKDVFQSLKSEGQKAEEKRKHYRNKVTSMRHELEDVSKKTDNLETSMKAAKDLKEGVKLGAQVMKLKGSVRAYYAALGKAEQFADDMEMLLKEAGVKVDNSTFVQRMKNLQALPDLAKFGKDLYSAAKDLQDIIGAIAQAAA